MAGYDGDGWLKFEVNDGWVSNFSDSLRFRVDNNNLPSVSIVEITTEQSDSVRFSYVLRDDERDTLRIRLEYSEDGEVWKVCSVSLYEPVSLLIPKTESILTTGG